MPTRHVTVRRSPSILFLASFLKEERTFADRSSIIEIHDVSTGFFFDLALEIRAVGLTEWLTAEALYRASDSRTDCRRNFSTLQSELRVPSDYFLYFQRHCAVSTFGANTLGDIPTDFEERVLSK